MRRASVKYCCRSSCIVPKYHGIEVSGTVGSLLAELTTGSSARRATRNAMCVDSELIDPKIAQTCSSYAIFTVSSDAEPQIAGSVGLTSPYTAFACQLL